jgi:hypothetical protein
LSGGAVTIKKTGAHIGNRGHREVLNLHNGGMDYYDIQCINDSQPVFVFVSSYIIKMLVSVSKIPVGQINTCHLVQTIYKSQHMHDDFVRDVSLKLMYFGGPTY